MPQIQLPVFPQGSTEFNDSIAVVREDQRVVYFNGHLPVFSHAADDVDSFRMFTSQLIVNGSATIGQVQRAFGVSPTTIKRYLAVFRKEGPAAFFTKAPPKFGKKLDAEKTAQAKHLLEQGMSVPEVSKETGVQQDTLRKAIYANRLPPAKKKG